MLLFCNWGLPLMAATLSASNSAASAGFLLESERELPIAYQVDVAVVGGTTGAVSAAVASCESGQTVFLAAPKTYLGEDVAGTLRLWLEEGEDPSDPLARRLFIVEPEAGILQEGEESLPFSYQASLPDADRHKDTDPPKRLSDGAWSSAARESVQYDGDVSITADLGEDIPIHRAHLLVYHMSDFQVASAQLETSTDGRTWKNAGTVENRSPPQSSVDEMALPLVADIDRSARFVRFSVQRAKGSSRVLLGEILLTRSVQGRTSSAAARPLPKPLHVKRELDKALLAAGVHYLYATYATDLLVDDKGNARGIVVANRAGRQAVLAKAVIDATSRAFLARSAGIQFRPFSSGEREVRRVIVGEVPKEKRPLSIRTLSSPYRKGYQCFAVHECIMALPMRDASFPSLAELDQRARDLTYSKGCVVGADQITLFAEDRMIARESSTGPWKGPEDIPLSCFQPKGMERFFVLGPYADVSDEQAKGLHRPLGLMALGKRLGQAAAKSAASAGDLGLPRLCGAQKTVSPLGEIREVLEGVRPFKDYDGLRQEGRDLPIVGEFDVVVIGGGTSGAPAGIAAARKGAKTLVVELLDGLGGVGTLGAISKYYWGNRVGFTKEVPGEKEWSIQERMEWWRNELRKAGAEIWFQSLGCGAWVINGQVQGAVVATPEGRGVVKARVVIDATGNADIAAAAGADCIYTDGRFLAVQGTGLPPLRLDAGYTNTDFTIVDETDMMDVWHVLVYTRVKAGTAFDMGQLVDTRERRRIVGDYTVSVIDQLIGRTYSDSVVEAYSNFDTHGYTVHPYFALVNPDKKGWKTYIPYRALLPAGLEGILVVGLGVSAERDAIPVIRMQPDIQNQGYAAGLAAALSAASQCELRKVNIKALQAHLVKIGNLSPEVPAHGEGPSFSDEDLMKAVQSLGNEQIEGVAVLFATQEKSIPLLQKAYLNTSSDREKLQYAKALALLADNSGIDSLIQEIESHKAWDQGWDYKSGGQFGSNMSRLDSFLFAVARTADRRALPALLDKLSLLTPDQAFSHHRAIAVALEAIGDPQAAPAIAQLLSLPGYRHQAVTGIQKAIEREKQDPNWGATEPRSKAIRELLLARALYRLGDHQDLGKQILEEYTQDLRGHLARHAHAVLQKDR